ncbi:MAG: Trk system potassium transporter TrkA [Acidimicrobiia bacterium]|nr:Trk system potassium transporter TrkA [Acidimicrobiia bacterium]MBT8214665.1 Trk system potassium transporter TrkA [Acidimicrobiia bacterium]NNK91302.1 Trk system potassium transporter TrkA [Acidimicrobiia bacterium]
MKIVIVGAGAVGSYLAERLSIEGQDVVVVESDSERADELQREVDCLVVRGNGASPAVLEEAGIKNADLLIAVTSSDAVNVLACHAGARLGVPRKVARVEDPALRAETEILGVDFIIDPGEALAREVLLLVRRGGVSENIPFADGRLTLFGALVEDGAPMVGLTLPELREEVPDWDWIVAAVIRQGETFIARGDIRIEAGDHVLVMADADRTSVAFRFMGVTDKATRKVMILGSTRLAQLSAAEISGHGIQTVLIDADAERCREVAAKFPDVVVVQGDPTDPKVMGSEGVDTTDAVIALTGWDEVNLMGCLIATALGIETTIARFKRFDLVSLMPGVGIDAGVSSRLAAANAILRLVRRGRIHSVATFQDSDAEAIELQVGPGSKAAGQSLAGLHLPKTAIVGGVLRGSDVTVPHGDTVLMAGDRVIIVALPAAITEVEELFE